MKPLLLIKGNNVRIRSREWFDYNEFNSSVGRFIPSMSSYCDSNAIVNGNLCKPLFDDFFYKLSIDGGKYDWQDFMFEVPSPSSPLLEKIYNDLCEFGCLRDCKSNKCLLFKYKKSYE